MSGDGERPTPKLGDSADRVLRIHRNPSWPPARLVAYITGDPHVTLGPGEGYQLVEYYEQQLAALRARLDGSV